MRLLFLALCLFVFTGCHGTQAKQQKHDCLHEHVKPSKYISSEDFKKKLGSPNKLYLVFGADWCSPCVSLHKRLVDAEIADKVIFLDADKTWAFILSRKMGVRGLPTLVVLEDGKILAIKETPGEILIHLLASVEKE